MRKHKNGAVILALVLAAVTAVNANDRVTRTRRNDALDWAIAYRQEAFDVVMPSPATRMVTLPECRVTVIRGSGSIDQFEFMFRFVEICGKHAAGEFIIPDGTPLTDQLARIRLANPAIEIDDAVKQLKIRRTELPNDFATRFIADLDALRFKPLPPTSIVLHDRAYEFISSSGLYIFAISVRSVDEEQSRRRFCELVKRGLKVAGRHEPMGFDSSWWTRED